MHIIKTADKSAVFTTIELTQANYSSLIAPTGQLAAQFPQEMQVSASILY